MEEIGCTSCPKGWIWNKYIRLRASNFADVENLYFKFSPQVQIVHLYFPGAQTVKEDNLEKKQFPL